MKITGKNIIFAFLFTTACILFYGCMQNKFHKPKNIEEAKNIIADIQAQFPKIIVSDTTTYIDSIIKNVEITVYVKKDDTTQYLSKTIDTVFLEIEKDCPNIKNIEQKYKKKLLSAAEKESEINSLVLDSAGYKISISTINGKHKINMSIPQLTKNINKNINTNNPCKELKYYQKLLEVWEIIALLTLIIIILIINKK